MHLVCITKMFPKVEHIVHNIEDIYYWVILLISYKLPNNKHYWIILLEISSHDLIFFTEGSSSTTNGATKVELGPTFFLDLQTDFNLSPLLLGAHETCFFFSTSLETCYFFSDALVIFFFFSIALVTFFFFSTTLSNV